jgi:hypothetical protein
LGDETVKLLNRKNDLQNIPVVLEIYNTRLVIKKLMQAYIDKA